MAPPLQPSSLILALQYAEQLPPVVRAELEQLAATIQNWSSKIQAADGSMFVQGMGTFLGQPIAKIFKRTAQSIANNSDVLLTWDRALSGSDLEEYDDFHLFDGESYFLLDKPGLYIAQAEIQWPTNAVGYRTCGIHPKIPAVDYFTVDRRDGSAALGPRQIVTSIFPVVQNSPLGPSIVPFPLPIAVQVFQNSGGALNLGLQGDRFGIWKVS